ncbi:unnamed protein product [Rotaria sp. Silwood1]|nr:unnamed protein product [Rotaria sp. Silwood1]
MGLHSPSNIYMTPNGNLYVADTSNYRVQLFSNGSRIGTTVAGDQTAGATMAQLNLPTSVSIDSSTGNMYISDTNNHRIQIWAVNATQSSTFVGGLDWCVGTQIDAQGYIYASDFLANQVLRWFPNGTYSMLVAGNGTAGSGNQSLNGPFRMDFDASVATAGVTVAGGNGAGNASSQLKYPRSIYVSRKTGSIYVADTNNHRIQRWSVGATQGVTIAGDPYCVSGNGAAQLNMPVGVILDANETYLFVSDQGNNRIQRFTLI